MTTLARQVRERGHEVFFICMADGEPMVRAAGLDIFVYGEEIFPAGAMTERWRQLSSLSGTEALRFTVNLFADTCRAALADGERALRESRADALVLDATIRGLNLVAMHLGIPYLHADCALHFDLSGHAPLCLFDWPHQPDPEGFARNLKGVKSFGRMAVPIVAMEREYGRRVGLPTDLEEATTRRLALGQITQTPREFDFPGDHWPTHFHYTGPWHEPSLRPAVDFPWERITGEPLIYASMGTLQNGSERIFQTIAAAAQAPGRQLVLSIGKNLQPGKIGPLAPNTILVAQAPQLEILQRASLCITHAGLNTTLESLTAGVPMVAIPITNDQPGVGARIAYTGTGVVVPLQELADEAGVPKLRGAIDKILNEPGYRENARRIQQAIARTNGLQLAADLIDRKLRQAVLTS